MNLVQFLWRPELQVLVVSQRRVIDTLLLILRRGLLLEDLRSNLGFLIVVLKQAVLEHNLVECILLDNVVRL